MLNDRDFEFVPLHRTAFAAHFMLLVAHETEADAQQELTGFLEWLEARQRGDRTQQTGYHPSEQPAPIAIFEGGESRLEIQTVNRCPTPSIAGPVPAAAEVDLQAHY